MRLNEMNSILRSASEFRKRPQARGSRFLRTVGPRHREAVADATATGSQYSVRAGRSAGSVQFDSRVNVQRDAKGPGSATGSSSCRSREPSVG